MSELAPTTLVGYSQAEGPEVDLVSDDRRLALRFAYELSSGRAYSFALLKLALYVAKHPSLERGCLVLIRPHMSEARIREEWKQILGILDANVVNRLRLLVMRAVGDWYLPTDPVIQELSLELRQKEAQENQAARNPTHGTRAGTKVYEVWKVLLNRWLLRQGPSALGELAAAVGCSYPTVRKALAMPALRKRLHHHSNRSVELTAFPHDAWNEICILGQAARVTYRYQDTSGEATSPLALVRRLEKLRPSGVAMSGVAAARHWDPSFDLHGTPRLDVLLHAPAARVDLGFVARLDPALALHENSTAAPLLVVQPLYRASSLFTDHAHGRLPIADPVETALSLLDLELTAQANHLLTSLRPEARLT